MPVNFYLKQNGFFSHDVTLIASVVGESVIGHGNEIRYSYEFISYLSYYVNSYLANSYIRIHTSRQGKTLE